MLKKINGRWLNVDVTLEEEVRTGPREVIFKSRVKDVTIEDLADPSKMEGDLGTVQLELEGEFSESKHAKVYMNGFIFYLTRLLDITEETAHDLILTLCNQTGAYYITDGYIRKV